MVVADPENVECGGALNSAVFSALSFACSLKSLHHTPHFQAYYQEDVGIFSIELAELIAGSLPKRQRRLVEAWAELHQQELMAGNPGSKSE